MAAGAPKDIRYYVSSWHHRSPMVNVIGVKEKVHRTYPDGSSEWLDNLRLYHDPVRPFWVTKPEFRLHTTKKEFEDIFRCDVFYVNDSQLEVALAEAINYPVKYNKLPSLRQLCSSPYVYGADMDTQTMIRQRYTQEVPPGIIPPYTRGALDIEAEPCRGGRINLITFAHEKKIYTGALREFCQIWDKDQKSSRPAIEEDCIKIIVDMLGDMFNQYGFELQFKILETELDLIKWAFQQVNKEKTDFIGIWNMGFDLPKILERIKACGDDPSIIMSCPDIPDVYKFSTFIEDKSQVAHITDKWHWFSYSGYSQFIDSMCLYARLRKASGRDSSYALDEISNKEIKQQKLHFGAITNHWYMQKYRFLEYIAYNINDVLLMMLMEWQNNDIAQAASLANMYLLSQFNHETVMLKSMAYDYSRHRGKIPAASGAMMFREFEETLPKAGGSVLPTEKATGVGTAIIEEHNDPTLVSVMTNDLDVSSITRHH